MSVGPMWKVQALRPKEVGEAVLAALDASRRDIKMPDVKELQKALYRFTKVRSWRDLARNSTSAHVARDNHVITIVPEKLGENNSLVPDGEGVPCPSASAEDLGSLVLQLLNRDAPGND